MSPFEKAISLASTRRRKSLSTTVTFSVVRPSLRRHLFPCLKESETIEKWRSIAILVGARLAIDRGPKRKPLRLFNTLHVFARSNRLRRRSLRWRVAPRPRAQGRPYTNIDRDASDDLIDLYRFPIDLDFNSPAAPCERVNTWNPPAQLLNQRYYANAEDRSGQSRIPIRFVAAVASGPTRKSRTDLEKRDRDIQPDRERPGADCLDLNLRRRVLTVYDSI